MQRLTQIEELSAMTKGVYFIIAGAVTWIGSAMSSLVSPPSSEWMIWLDKYGFPTVVSILFLAGVVIMFKAYCGARDETSEVQEARIKDRDLSIEQYRNDFTEAQSSRLQIVETNRRTVEVLTQVKDELQAMQGFRVRKPKMLSVSATPPPNANP